MPPTIMKVQIWSGASVRLLLSLIWIALLVGAGKAAEVTPITEAMAWQRLEGLKDEFYSQEPESLEADVIEAFMARGRARAGTLADEFNRFLKDFPESTHANAAWQERMDLLGFAAQGSAERMEELQAVEQAVLADPQSSDSHRRSVRFNQIQRATDLVERERLIRASMHLEESPNAFFCQQMLTVASHSDYPRSLEIVEEILDLTSPPSPEVVAEIEALRAERARLSQQPVRDDAWLEQFRVLSLKSKDLGESWFGSSKYHRDQAMELKGILDRVGKPLELTFITLDGTEVDLRELRGKVVLLDFWATWCPPCLAKVPEVNRILKEYGERGFEVIGISYDSERDVLQQFLRENDLPWIHYFQPEGMEAPLVQSFGKPGPPAYWLIDQNGVLVDVTAGNDLEGKVLRLLEADDASNE